MSAASGKRGLPACYVRPMLRRQEVARLARWRRSAGRYTDPHAAMTVAGHAIASLEGMRQRSRSKHPGLDLLTAEDFLQLARLDLVEVDTIDIVHQVNRSREGDHPFVMTDIRAGELLELQREERTGLGITTIEAFDEPAEARRARKAIEKRERDRERQRTRRRQAGIAKKAKDAEPERPWEALGISRRTWFYRQSRQMQIDCTPASRTSSPCTPASRTSLTEGLRRTGAIHSVQAHRGAAAQRPASLSEISRAETSILLLLGRGDADQGRRVASMIDPAHIRRWIAAVRDGTLAGDERVDLEFVRIQTMQTMRQAS